MIIAFIGPEGGGKSAALAHACLLHHVRGGEVHAFPGFDVWAPKREGKRVKRGEKISETIGLEDWLDLGPQYDGSLFAIDEMQNFFDAQRFMTILNKLFGYMTIQRRKRGLTIAYSVQNLQWIDNRIRWATHVLAYCYDLYWSPWGKHQGLKRGELTRVTFIDQKGFFTGREWQPIGQIMLRTKELWACFNSFAPVDVWTGMSKVSVLRPEIEIDARGGKVPTEQEQKMQQIEPQGLLTPDDLLASGMDEIQES